MGKKKINSNIVRTDLILEQELSLNNHKKTINKGQFTITNNKFKKNNYTTIYFDDITDQNDFLELQKLLLDELKKLIKIKENDLILIIGLGNEKSTPDSLGPKTLDHILVTRYLKLYSSLDKDYTNVAIYKPDVIGNTGVESIDIIKGIKEKIKPTKIIVIDSLKANSLDRLNKTIQITDSGIHPGSGILNNRGEISKKTFNCDVYAIGIPTVVDIYTIISEYNKNPRLKENFIVTPTNIDYLVERLSYLLGDTLNILLHKNYLRQIKNK